MRRCHLLGFCFPAVENAPRMEQKPCVGCGAFEEARRAVHHLHTAHSTGSLDDDEVVEVIKATGKAPKKRKLQAKLAAVVTDKETQRNLDHQLTRWIVGSNLPFRCVESPSDLGINLQTGKPLPVLCWTTCTEKLFLGSKTVLKRQYATVQLDGWTSPQHDPTLTTSIQVNRESFLWDVEETNGTAHTAKWLANRLLEIIRALEADLGVVVIAVTTDSASNMKTMKEIAEEERGDLLYMPCTAHWLHNASKDCGDDGPRSLW